MMRTDREELIVRGYNSRLSLKLAERSMRLVTWNCHHGECLERASELDGLAPDIILLQECGRPKKADDARVQWFGELPTKGVAVIARGDYWVTSGPVSPAMPHSVFPVRFDGPHAFNLLAVHALRRPTYVQAVSAGLTAYSGFLNERTSLVAGDFNSHSHFDRVEKRVTHSMLIERLKDEFGLISAYHAYSEGNEEATYFHQFKDNQPFHIDYCFVPESLASKLREARIMAFTDWKGRSDHHPLLIELDLDRISS